MDTTHPDSHGLACMEIWGGNLPADSSISTPGLDVHVLSKPLDDAGGDVHYVSLCGGGFITRILLADVSGHGAKAAVVATDLRNLIRRYINTKSQSRLVQRLNQKMQAWAGNGLFATSLIATYLADRRELTLCNAGHPRPLLFRNSSKTWDFLNTKATSNATAADLPLGIIPGTAYTQVSIVLDPGDLLVCYTDMLLETHDATGTAFGEQGVMNIARRLGADGQIAPTDLLCEITRTAGKQSPADDVTILIFRHNGGGPQPPALIERLQVYGKVFGMIPV